MKFKITMKDPDGVYDSIANAAKASVNAVSGIDPEEREELIELRHTTLDRSISKWFEYGEYVVIEIDTEANTATVLPK